MKAFCFAKLLLLLAIACLRYGAADVASIKQRLAALNTARREKRSLSAERLLEQVEEAVLDRIAEVSSRLDVVKPETTSAGLDASAAGEAWDRQRPQGHTRGSYGSSSVRESGKTKEFSRNWSDEREGGSRGAREKQQDVVKTAEQKQTMDTRELDKQVKELRKEWEGRRQQHSLAKQKVTDFQSHEDKKMRHDDEDSHFFRVPEDHQRHRDHYHPQGERSDDQRLRSQRKQTHGNRDSGAQLPPPPPPPLAPSAVEFPRGGEARRNGTLFSKTIKEYVATLESLQAQLETLEAVSKAAINGQGPQRRRGNETQAALEHQADNRTGSFDSASVSVKKESPVDAARRRLQGFFGVSGGLGLVSSGFTSAPLKYALLESNAALTQSCVGLRRVFTLLNEIAALQGRGVLGPVSYTVARRMLEAANVTAATVGGAAEKDADVEGFTHSLAKSVAHHGSAGLVVPTILQTSVSQPITVVQPVATTVAQQTTTAIASIRQTGTGQLLMAELLAVKEAYEACLSLVGFLGLIMSLFDSQRESVVTSYVTSQATLLQQAVQMTSVPPQQVQLLRNGFDGIAEQFNSMPFVYNLGGFEADVRKAAVSAQAAADLLVSPTALSARSEEFVEAVKDVSLVLERLSGKELPFSQPVMTALQTSGLSVSGRQGAAYTKEQVLGMMQQVVEQREVVKGSGGEVLSGKEAGVVESAPLTDKEKEVLGRIMQYLRQQLRDARANGTVKEFYDSWVRSGTEGKHDLEGAQAIIPGGKGDKEQEFQDLFMSVLRKQLEQAIANGTEEEFYEKWPFMRPKMTGLEAEVRGTTPGSSQEREEAILALFLKQLAEAKANGTEEAFYQKFPSLRPKETLQQLAESISTTQAAKVEVLSEWIIGELREEVQKFLTNGTRDEFYARWPEMRLKSVSENTAGGAAAVAGAGETNSLIEGYSIVSQLDSKKVKGLEELARLAAEQIIASSNKNETEVDLDGYIFGEEVEGQSSHASSCGCAVKTASCGCPAEAGSRRITVQVLNQCAKTYVGAGTCGGYSQIDLLYMQLVKYLPHVIEWRQEGETAMRLLLKIKSLVIQDFVADSAAVASCGQCRPQLLQRVILMDEGTSVALRLVELIEGSIALFLSDAQIRAVASQLAMTLFQSGATTEAHSVALTTPAVRSSTVSSALSSITSLFGFDHSSHRRRLEGLESGAIEGQTHHSKSSVPMVTHHAPQQAPNVVYLQQVQQPTASVIINSQQLQQPTASVMINSQQLQSTNLLSSVLAMAAKWNVAEVVCALEQLEDLFNCHTTQIVQPLLRETVSQQVAASLVPTLMAFGEEGSALSRRMLQEVQRLDVQLDRAALAAAPICDPSKSEAEQDGCLTFATGMGDNMNMTEVMEGLQQFVPYASTKCLAVQFALRQAALVGRQLLYLLELLSMGVGQTQSQTSLFTQAVAQVSSVSSCSASSQLTRPAGVYGFEAPASEGVASTKQEKPKVVGTREDVRTTSMLRS